MERLERIFAARWVPAAAVALALALTAPSLTTGLCADDWYQRIMGVGPSLPGMARPRLDLFSFADGNPAHTHALIDAGVFPWWTDPDLKLSFFRPLTALTHEADWALWRDSPLLMHAQNLFWFALALVAAAWVYRRLLLPPWTAALALVLYAVDDTHGPAVGWVANRNVMIAMALALPALALHDRARRDGWRPARWLAPLSLAAGLAAGEAAVAVAGYLLAYQLILDEGRLRTRLGRLWPYGLVGALWIVVYRALGHGAAHSGVYFDPVGDPAAYFRELPGRAAALIVGQLSLPWSDFAPMWPYLGPRVAAAMSLWSAITVVILVWLFAPLVRRDRAARFFAVGAVLALLPVCSAIPADRLLWFVGIGAMGLLARFFATPRAGLRRLLGGLLIVLHLFLAPALLALRSRSMLTVRAPLRAASQSLPSTPEIADQTIILLNPPSDFFAGYILVSRAAEGEPRPARLRWLAPGVDGVELVREDAFTLRAQAHGGFTGHLGEQMLRSNKNPLAAGQRVELTGLTIEVLSRDEARFRFSVPLEDTSLVWMSWGTTGYQLDRPPSLPPSMDQRRTLPPISVVAEMFRKR